MNPQRIRSFVRLFKPQFAPLVEAGEKCQTVRPIPKRTPRPGDHVSLRTWTGAPYRSKQRILREATITDVAPVAIGPTGIRVNDTELSSEEALAFARADGFESTQALFDWFASVHGLPFDGVLIKWSNSLPSQ